MKEQLVEPATNDLAAFVAHGRRLEYFTIFWNCLESLVAIGAGLMAGSIALVEPPKSSPLKFGGW